MLRQPVQRKRLAGVVGDLTSHGDAGDVREDVLTGLGQRGLRDIDGLIDDASLLPHRGGEQNSGLGGGACAKFDESELARGPLPAGSFAKDLFGMRCEDAAFGARQVVLGKLGDLLEEPGACLVVEEPGRQRLWALRTDPRELHGPRLHWYWSILLDFMVQRRMLTRGFPPGVQA